MNKRCPGHRAPYIASKLMPSIVATSSLWPQPWQATSKHQFCHADVHNPEQWHQDKNIGHKASVDLLLCPNAAFWRVIRLRYHGDPHSAPLARFMTPMGILKNITPTMISKTLKTVVGFCGPNLGFKAKDISDRPLCAAGAMALLY